MNIHTLAFAMIALSAPLVSAATAAPTSRTAELGEAIVRLETRYHPGKIVAIELDASGDKAAHYHVDMSFPESGLALLDVDAVKLEAVSRESAALEAGSMTLAEVATLLTTAIPGQMLVATLDTSYAVPAHYDVDVRLPHGPIARLKVDATTREIGWRTPAIVND